MTFQNQPPGILDKISAGWRVMKAGEVVSSPAAWKNRQVTVVYLAGFLSAIVAAAKVFGYEIPVTEAQLSAIATTILFIVGLFNHAATVASTDKIDILGRPEPTQQMEVASDRIAERDNSSNIGNGVVSGSEKEVSAKFDPTGASDSNGS